MYSSCTPCVLECVMYAARMRRRTGRDGILHLIVFLFSGFCGGRLGRGLEKGGKTHYII